MLYELYSVMVNGKMRSGKTTLIDQLSKVSWRKQGVEFKPFHIECSGDKPFLFWTGSKGFDYSRPPYLLSCPEHYKMCNELVDPIHYYFVTHTHSGQKSVVVFFENVNSYPVFHKLVSRYSRGCFINLLDRSGVFKNDNLDEDSQYLEIDKNLFPGIVSLDITNPRPEMFNNHAINYILSGCGFDPLYRRVEVNS